MASSAGRTVVHTFGYGGGRQVTVWVPPAAPDAVVYAADGQLIATWAPDLEAAGTPPSMVVAVHRADDPGVRLQEYVCPPQAEWADPERFAAHESFFVEEVRAWVGATFGVDFPPERTAVCGVSAGAELALAVALRHPHRYGVVLGASPGGGFLPPADLAGPLPRVFLVAGRGEPFFLANAARWAVALRSAGGEVTLTEREGEHGGPFWREEWPRMLRGAFTP